MLQAGQAINALPQLASAKVNCRIIPGETGDDAARIHGRDERVPVKSFYEGNEYLYRLVKMLAGGA